jgi:hypothetical protein
VTERLRQRRGGLGGLTDELSGALLTWASIISGMIKTRAIAAYREAGHAAIADNLGADVCRVSIEGDSGRTQIKRLGRGVGRIERPILINLANPYAQRRYAPRSRWRNRSQTGFTSGYDFDKVTGLIHAVNGTGKIAEAYWRDVEARAETLVEQHWWNTDAVAQTLLQHGMIGGASERSLSWGTVTTL